MAKIIWQKRAQKELDIRLADAEEYGKKTVRRWMEQIMSVEKRMATHPESFTQEFLLGGKRRLYRRAIIMTNFKIIYYYTKSSDTVWIVDIWDMRMSPDRLMGRIK